MAEQFLGNPRQIQDMSDTLDNLEILLGALNPNATISDGRRTVASAGTRVQLSTTSVPVKKVIIQALQSNTGFIAVGGSTVVAATGSERGYILLPFNSITLTVTNLNLIYLDSTVDGEGVSYTYEV